MLICTYSGEVLADNRRFLVPASRDVVRAHRVRACLHNTLVRACKHARVGREQRRCSMWMSRRGSPCGSRHDEHSWSTGSSRVRCVAPSSLQRAIPPAYLCSIKDPEFLGTRLFKISPAYPDTPTALDYWCSGCIRSVRVTISQGWGCMCRTH